VKSKSALFIMTMLMTTIGGLTLWSTPGHSLEIDQSNVEQLDPISDLDKPLPPPPARATLSGIIVNENAHVDSAGDQSRTEATTKLCDDCSTTVDPSFNRYKDLGEDVKIAALKLIADNKKLKDIRASASKVHGGRGDHHCYHDVKRIVNLPGVLPFVHGVSPLTGVYARNAGKDLAKNGFTNLMAPGQIMEGINNPCLAPPGAILVYEGGPIIKMYNRKAHDLKALCGPIACGHVEVKIGDINVPDFAGNFRSSHPVTGSCVGIGNHFVLTAIMVPTESIPGNQSQAPALPRLASSADGQ